MAKNKNEKIIFLCSECGDESPYWQGKCKGCGEWNTYKEFKDRPILDDKNYNVSESSKPQYLKDIKIESESRILTGIDELDRTLSGGLVSGQVILLGGNPGIGKSTLILQLAGLFKGKVLYVSGEESQNQVALRSKRLGIESSTLEILSTNNLNSVEDALNHDLLIVDSIQTVMVPNVPGSTGSVTQIKESSFKIISWAKQKGIPVIIIGHITKDGNIAGPKLLEHMVDTVLYLEGEKTTLLRTLRVQKNRFGDDSEVGLFEMSNDGMSGVKDPYIFIKNDFSLNASGSAVCMILEGKRAMPIEVQALVTKSVFGYPKRTSSGYSLNRLQLLCAVLEKRSKNYLSDQDVYLNIASGVQVREPAIDLAVCAAIISSLKDKAIKPKTIFFGEVGLSGEIRSITGEEKRTKESKNLGFENIISAKDIRNITDLKRLLVL